MQINFQKDASEAMFIGVEEMELVSQVRIQNKAIYIPFE